MWQQTCALDRMATRISLRIKLNIDKWGFACTLQTHEACGNDDDDYGKIKGKVHPRTGHEGPEGE